MAKDKSEPPAPLPGKNSRSRKWLVIGIVVAVVVLAGGGGAAYWKWGMASAQEGENPEAAPSHESEVEPGMVAFEPFLVNLADEGGQSYLRVTLSLLVATDEEAKLLETKPVTRTQIRSSVIEVLSVHTAGQLSTPEGKTALKRAIADRVKSLNLHIEVRDVLFSDFVVQY